MTAEVARPRPSVASTYLNYGSNTLTVSHSGRAAQHSAPNSTDRRVE